VGIWICTQNDPSFIVTTGLAESASVGLEATWDGLISGRFPHRSCT
jgi:hypothetical protein